MTLKRRLTELEQKVDLLNRLHRVMNAIKRDCAYSDKELLKDITKLRKQGVDEEEIELLEKLWKLRKAVGNELLKETKKLIEEVDKHGGLDKL